MAIYDIPEIVRNDLLLATTAIKRMCDFRKTGRFLFHRDILTDSNFMPSYVTDSSNRITTLEPFPDITIHRISPSPRNLPGLAGVNQLIDKSPILISHFPTADNVKLFTKAEPTQNNAQTKTKRTSTILSDTLLKEVIQK